MCGSWTLLVPLKRLAEAKTRLRGALPGIPHADLVLALALDTVDAAVRCPVVERIVVVTADEVAAVALSARGASIVPDRTPGLNPALECAAGTLPPGSPVAAITADLPALRPADLARVLRRPADRRRWFVPDAAGTGTTLLAAPTGVLAPRFGPGSAAAHRACGAVAVTDAGMSLRCDVDTPADLAMAVALGAGPRTSALCRAGTPQPGT